MASYIVSLSRLMRGGKTHGGMGRRRTFASARIWSSFLGGGQKQPIRSFRGFLWKVDEHGRVQSTRFLKAAEALVASLDADEQGARHFCYVSEGNELAPRGAPIGSPCCRSFAGSVEKPLALLQQWFLRPRLGISTREQVVARSNADWRGM